MTFQLRFEDAECLGVEGDNRLLRIWQRTPKIGRRTASLQPLARTPRRKHQVFTSVTHVLRKARRLKCSLSLLTVKLTDNPVGLGP